MTLTQLIKDLIDTSKERLKTPISGAFLWSFIVFNWRPMAVLLFSKTTIEGRIKLINNDYWNLSWWSWLIVIVPFLMALVYTILIPMLTLRIEIILTKTKNARLKHRNEYIGLQKDGKINLAGKEWLLKNAESGNKEIEDRLDEIKSLKETIEIQQESIKQINQTNKATVEELNNSLKSANTENSNRIERQNFENLRNIILGDTIHLDEEQANEIASAGASLNFGEFKVLKTIDVDDISPKFFARDGSSSLLESLSQKKILNIKISDHNKELYEVKLTQLGVILSDIIKST